MDRFVTRTPTWKTLNYSSMAAQYAQKNGLAKKANDDDIKKKPLQQKQLAEIIKKTYDFEKRRADLLYPAQHENDENFNANSNDSGLSSASSTSQIGVNGAVSLTKKILSPTKTHLDDQFEKENGTYMTIMHTPKSHKKVVKFGLQVEETLEVDKNFNPEINTTPEKPLRANNMIMARIQKDLNSPSAAARVKAIKALKSPTKSAYSQFDVPEAEQSLHIPDPPSLQDIMCNIVVYVEVRSGEDNRSAGVRKVIQALGARVSLSLNRETTHVIFKDGLLSTYKKAIQMNIPIVSILWIEACKNQCRICDPNDYPISNLDRYENPELYTKMKRVKSMQPDSECNKRIRAKGAGTPKDSTPTQKTGNLKKTSTFIGGTPTSSTNKKKTDITKFFKKIEKPTPSPAAYNEDCATISLGASIAESPASQLLNRIDSECYTPLNVSKSKASTQENNNNEQKCSVNTSKFSIGAKKILNFAQTDNAEEIITASIRCNMAVGIKATIAASPLPKTRGRPRRHSLVSDFEIETATNSMNTMAISVSTPRKYSNRRSSINTPKDMSLAALTPTNAINIPPPIMEENDKVREKQDNPSKSVNSRRTLHVVQTMDQTDLMECNTIEDLPHPNTRHSRRRTLYTNNTMETSETKNVVNKDIFNVTNRRRTCLNADKTEIRQRTDNKTGNIPNEGSEIINLIAEVETSKACVIKAAKNSSRRKTLYESKIISETCIDTLDPSVTAGSSIFATPTNFKTGQVASSTLLDVAEDNRSNLMLTPAADATTGKLLEESGKCTTPLIFSSTRQPGSKRRTLFDASMDIITQRLQFINKSARRSLAPPTPSAEVVNTVENLSTPLNLKKSKNILFNATTPKSSTESINECTDNNDDISDDITDTITLKKKRKLFMPNDFLVTPGKAVPSDSANIAFKTSEESNKLINHTSNSPTKKATTKRRRTLMPISQPQPTTIVTPKDSLSSTAGTTVKKRRSTLDFEQTQTKASNGSPILASSVRKNATKQQNKAKNTPVLVCTNMHQQQVDVIREVIDKLGLFVLETCVTNNTTHLVSLEPRRTLNLLRALARGLWILDYSWIVDSLKAGKWLPEELYELQGFSRAIEICRSERQAFGNNYKCELFRKFGAFYISSNCYPISKENLSELIVLCGGHVVNARHKARYIIGDANGTLKDKLYLTPHWVLDSITRMTLMKASKYMYHLPGDDKTVSQPLPSEENN